MCPQVLVTRKANREEERPQDGVNHLHILNGSLLDHLRRTYEGGDEGQFVVLSDQTVERTEGTKSRLVKREFLWTELWFAELKLTPVEGRAVLLLAPV